MKFNINNLNPTQKKAVQSTDKPLLIFAGAGSGKTRVLTYKIAYLVEEKGISPKHILAVTFTNKAASEMKDRVQDLLPNQDVSRMSVGTFHSINARILRKEIHRLGYSNDFTIYDSDDSKRLIKSVILNHNLDVKQFEPKSVRTIISWFKNKMKTPEEIQNGANGFREENIAEIYNGYQIELKNNNAVDFDDLLVLPLDIFREYPERLNYYQSLYEFVLVDEYQDTNKPQFKFVYALSQKHRNICVVGDDDQSIYGWRGADIKNILDFEESFGDVEIVKLEQNYRSTQNILDAAFSVVSQNENRAPKKLWTENKKGELITVIESLDERDEARKILDTIQKEYSKNGKDLDNFVILYRTNAQSRPIEDQLRRNSIPYTIVGGVKFYDRKEVKDVLAYLRLIVNPLDSISFERIINFPVRGIGKTTVDKLKSFGKENNKSLFDTLQNSNELPIGQKQKQSIELFHKLIEFYRNQIDKETADNIINSLVDNLGLEEFYLTQETEESMERWENVNALISSITEFCERNENVGLKEFLEEVSLLSDIDEWNESRSSVTLMTLHSAKGLEFPIVFIAGMEDGLFPITSRLESEEDMEEERRLFYVGVTRAEEKVYLSYANSRRRFGGMPVSCIRSQFLDELPNKLVEFKSTRKRNVPIYQTNKSTHYRKSISNSPSSESKSNYQVGDVVSHKIFGTGTVLRVEGAGENAKLTVQFTGNVRKKIVAKFVK
ncbi:MAG: UvrD-helicase domain-containing protein [Candidatus Marinimicrobia bacterium]|nr:UvrD-helicase domain-containing protein [Candidatus Neomarinimicrobiota bacterium]MBL7023641.1 UvrD-helicase domain-containing protein [Candidatus Neomarinimicrobiota bacterium]MBL7109793.1 UvrD-helicase domain-containing protein [Candidatus Neomarinimicrobiota bacterium]